MSLEDGVKISAKLCTKIYVWDEVDNSGRFPKLFWLSDTSIDDSFDMLVAESIC